MSRPHLPLWTAALSLLVIAAGSPPAPATSAAAAAAATVSTVKSPPLRADELDRLLAPYAGAPQDSLGVVLDACRYPADLVEASGWSQQAEATRGPAKQTWPPTVRLLAERAPRTLEYLTRDLAATSALGSAYQNQPNDVWLAYGRVTERQLEASDEPAGEAKASSGGSRPAPQPRPQAAQPSAPAAPSSPAAPPAPPPTTAVGRPEAPPPAQQTVVVQSQAEQGPSTAGAALAGGVVGLGAGLLISELVHDDDGWGHGIPGPYAVPPPYLPYGGATAGALQANRVNALSNLQNNRAAVAREL
ncbi:DUF3300 domain-containing protein, partial [Paracraurococcus lichenis]